MQTPRRPAALAPLATTLFTLGVPALLGAQQPVRISAVTLSAAQVTEGRQVAGAVALERAARAGGVVVQLTASDTSLHLAATSVTIPENQTQATFLVTGGHVFAARSGTITASAGGSTASGALTVKPITLTAVALTGSMAAGRTIGGRIALEAPAPVSLLARVSISGTGFSQLVDVPIAANASMASFSFRAPCPTTRTVLDLRATIVGSSVGSASTSVQLAPPSLILLGRLVSGIIDPSPLRITGGQTIQMRGVASCAQSGAASTVALSTTGQPLVTSTVTIPAGDTLAAWSQFIPVVNANTTSTLTATLNGQSTSYSISILGRQLLGMRVPDTLRLGRSTSVSGQGNVVLDHAAQPGGVLVTLRVSGDPSVPVGLTIPGTVTVPQGSTGTTFPITFAANARNVPARVLVEAQLNGSVAAGKIVLIP